MSEAPQSARKGFATAPGPSAPALVPFLKNVIDDLGDQSVSAGALIDAILVPALLGRLPGDLSIPPWPATARRQPVRQWEAEFRRILADDVGEITAYGAAIALALADGSLTSIAESSGLLGALVAETVSPSSGLPLKPAGLRLLARRAPLVAIAAGVLPPTVSQQFREPAATISVAPQTGVPSGQIGRWAVDAGELWEGRGQSYRSRGIRNTRALGWHGDTLRAFRVTDDGEAAFWSGTTPATESRAGSPGTSWYVGEAGASFVNGDGRLLVGELDGDRVTEFAPIAGSADADIQYALHAVTPTSDGQRIAAVPTTKGMLQIFEDGTLVSSERGTRRIRSIAVSADWLYLDATKEGLLARSWSPRIADREDERLLTREPVPDSIPLAAGGDLLVRASLRTAAVFRGSSPVVTIDCGDQVTAVDVSPDGKALAIGTHDGRFRVWRLDAPGELQLTSYSNDATDAGDEDLLGISTSVDALATLLSAKATEPPLSIGLFGQWGSGKSFFMEKLEARVTEITQDGLDSEEPQHALWAWRNISQIRFNAWHYAAAEVWAGLLDHLIKELAKQRAGRLKLPTEIDELQRQRIARLNVSETELTAATEQLKSAKHELDQAAQQETAAKDELAQATTDLKDAKDKAARQVLTGSARQAAREALTPLGLGAAADTVADTLDQLREARQRVMSVKELVGGRNGVRLGLALLAGPVIAAVAAVAVWFFRPELAGVAAAVGGLITFAAAGKAWLARTITHMDEQLAPIIAAEEEARAALAQNRQQLADAVTATAVATTRVVTAERTLESRQQEVNEARARVDAADAGNLLEEYLSNRSESRDYQTQLGIVGTVRSDLEAISRCVKLHNDTLDDPEVTTTDDVVNRVILYVDDLDRCPPHVVVKVLEAVHLLLSYPLFVVVVAVDAHWVSRSLTTVYPTMLSGGEVTPDHYLEKIFQLPVWLDSPDSGVASAMLRTLFEPTPPGAVLTTGQPIGPAQAPAQAPTQAPANQAPAYSGSGARPPPPWRGSGLASTPPRALQMADGETDQVAALARLLNRTPRALKRFLNTYRLLKVLVDDPADLAMARLLLAIATGRPDLGERLLRQILDQPTSPDRLPSLVELWDQADQAWLRSKAPEDWTTYTCADASRAASQVRRFVYRTSALPTSPPPRSPAT